MKNVLGGCLSFILILFVICCIIAFPIKWLWNWLMPELFNLPIIGFWKALGIGVFAGLLFGGTKFKVSK